jgi:hypothetical protein
MLICLLVPTIVLLLIVVLAESAKGCVATESILPLVGSNPSVTCRPCKQCMVPERTSSFGCQVRLQSRLNSVNQLIFVMVKCGVLFEVRTEFLNNI